MYGCYVRRVHPRSIAKYRGYWLIQGNRSYSDVCYGDIILVGIYPPEIDDSAFQWYACGTPPLPSVLRISTVSAQIVRHHAPSC